jgi:2-methylisocitrate lyase-like PEP mutase family enzyme
MPLVADADTGYGSPINVVRTVREYEAAGVAAIQLEDQTFPKRCGHLAGKEVISADAFALSLQAAVDAREEMLIVARTDARAPLGLDEAIERGNQYASIGADVIFVEAPRTVEEIEQIGARVDAPLLLNLVPGGLTPEVDHGRLIELGYRIAIYPGAVMMAVVSGAIESLSKLRGQSLDGDRVLPGPEAFFDLFGLSEWQTRGERYA